MIMNMTHPTCVCRPTKWRGKPVRNLIVPLSDQGWDRLDEIMQDLPKLGLHDLIEKAIYFAWHADNKELA